MGVYDARSVANEVLLQAQRTNRSVTNLTLQKVCFFVHGMYMAKYGSELIKGEFEAWTFGPVHRVLFHALQNYRDRKIETLITRIDPITGENKGPLKISNQTDAAFVCDVADFFLSFTAGQLVELSHAPGSPWNQVWEKAKSNPNIGMKIPNLLVQDFYSRAQLKGEVANGQKKPS